MRHAPSMYGQETLAAAVPRLNRRDLLFRTWLTIGLLAALLPAVGPGPALLAGLIGALVLNRSLPATLKKQAKRLLQLGVIGLGFSLNLGEVFAVGLPSMLVAAVTISGTFLLAQAAARLLKVEANTAMLIAAGTAICGGSAIAAVGTAIRAKEAPIAVAMGTVFLLNAASLLLFPLIGNTLQLQPEVYGQWVGFAIHDVSSVVGAADVMGPDALQTATTVKLARTLWIIPVTFAILAFRHHWADRKNVGACDDAKQTPAPRPAVPWFIVGFLAASALTTVSPTVHHVAPFAVTGAKALLAASLFLIGASIGRSTLRQAGPRPILLGCLLWFAVATVGFVWLQ